MDEVEIFSQALEIDDAAQRQVFLDEACGENVALKQRLQAYLQSADVAGSFLESPGPPGVPAANPEVTPSSQGAAPALLHQLATGVLGDYRLRQEIGRGGMGVVYEAEQISLGRRVALKVLPYASMLDKTQLARFKNEARAAASLDHPHVVHVHSVGMQRGVHYYAMQLIDGQTVSDLIAAERAQHRAIPALGEALPPTSSGYEPTEAFAADGVASPRASEARRDTAKAATPNTSTRTNGDERSRIRMAVKLAMQAAEAIEHAHRMGIVHRDIKPSNLLVDAEHHLWVADFGLAMIGDNNVSGTFFSVDCATWESCLMPAKMCRSPFFS